ncbi:MAG: hypothetical protein PUB49_05025 [Selenomonadaceae bacterium]|nr:hypothetical protein [Selenomonadaceae bacterium]
MVNALGQVSTAGTPVHDKEKECRGSMVFECHSRKATPEELERYFGDKPRILSKDELRERPHPTQKKPTIDDVIAAARDVDERKYKAMKAAVIIIGIVNGWK